jgi:hypothetical protein
MLALLKDAPLIETWLFHDTGTTKSFVDINAAIGCGDLVPVLRRFECDLEVADAMLIPMLERRGKFVDQPPAQYATLESVVVYGEPKPTGRLRQYLGGLKNRGVGVALRY